MSGLNPFIASHIPLMRQYFVDVAAGGQRLILPPASRARRKGREGDRKPQSFAEAIITSQGCASECGVWGSVGQKAGFSLLCCGGKNVAGRQCAHNIIRLGLGKIQNADCRRHAPHGA